jgi:predicted transcriptional regulator YheO
MLWLFGEPCEKRIMRSKISSLEIDSFDIFTGMYKYSNGDHSFMVNVQLDYIRRQKERWIEILCENGDCIYCDFINKNIERYNFAEKKKETYSDMNLFNLDETYSEEVREFLNIGNYAVPRLSSLEESIRVLKHLSEV